MNAHSTSIAKLLTGLTVLTALVVVSASCIGRTPRVSDADISAGLLTIGSTAPAPDIEHWISDGHGELPKISQFEDGKVYVVEFWATWCGPCVASMPHLSNLQQAFMDDSVQIISITDEDLDSVERFLKMKVSGKKEMTYGELTGNYCLTADPDGSMSENYLQAARQTGIPAAFIVGKTGKIEWIGHPAEMELPLSQVVADSWNREAFAVKFKAEQEAELAREAAQEKLQIAMQPVADSFQAGKTEEALKLMDDLIANNEFDAVKEDLVFTKMDLAFSVSPAAATEAFRKALDQLKDSPGVLHELAWSIYSLKSEGEPIGKDMLQVALDAAKQAEAATPKSPEILDTVARIHYELGQLDEAIKVQTIALENADGMEQQIKPFLDKLKAEKRAKAE